MTFILPDQTLDIAWILDLPLSTMSREESSDGDDDYSDTLD